MKKYFSVLILLFACILAIEGCASAAKKDNPPINAALVEPQSSTRFSDIPVPAKFKLLSKNSYTFESGSMRVAVLRYKGWTSVDKIVNFYKEQMLMNGWSLMNIVEYGDHLLNFDREQETCTVLLSPQINGVLVNIFLGPKLQARKAEKPVK